MVDPNVVYFLLVVGLWIAVTAAYIPGTGVVEVVALVAVGAAVYILANMPTNWAGAILLMLGVLSFLLIPFLSQRWARVAEAGLLLQVAGAFTLFHGVQVSWLLIGVTVGLSILYHRLVLLPVLERSKKQVAVIDDTTQLVGAYGRVVKASSAAGHEFVGSVNVRGEQWTAYSDHPLQMGEEVVVVEREGLQLFVESVKHKQTPREQMEGS